MKNWMAGLPAKLQDMVKEVDQQIAPRLVEIDEQVLYNQQRVLDLYREHHVAEEDLVGSTGYGTDDIGRDKLESIFADYFKTDDALIRPQLATGTHAISTGLFACLRPGDTLYYMTGTPYDTIQEVIGIAGDNPGTMKDFGIDFDTTELLPNGKVDYDGVAAKLRANDHIKVVAIQRSCGYATRASFTVAEIKEMIAFVRQILPNVIIFVDNCYGEFSETEEPTFYGADLMAGSFFKNAGAGFVKSGSFLVGRQDLIDACGARLMAPGIGKAEGATYAYMRDYFEGFFMAPHTTGDAIKGAIFEAALLEKMGLDVSPKWNEPRTDIVQKVIFGKPEPMIKFCGAIQHHSALNAFVDPIPSHMDGYEDKVIMASGSFIEGSTIELSCDGPLREPYCLYIQGGLAYAHIKVAVTHAVAETFFAEEQ